MNDVTASNYIRPSQSRPLQTCAIGLKLDGISQEYNETFSIKFVGLNYVSFAPEAPVTIDYLNGMVVDQDSKPNMYCGLR